MTGIYDIVMMALAVWREDRGGSYQSRLGVAFVIYNRMNDKRWPDKASQVILQHNQFSSFLAGDPNATKFPVPGSGEFGAFDECLKLATDLLGEGPPVGGDPTAGANFYHSFSDPTSPHWPTWATDDTFTAKLDGLSFYKR